MTPSRYNDLDLLRDIYKGMDRHTFLAEHPELTADDLDAFFRRMAERVGGPAKNPEPPAPVQEDANHSDIVIYTDGGSRGNPGPAGFGAVLMDPQGNVLDTLSVFIGRATNNEAEYRALIEGLRAAQQRGARRITVRADSELVIRQITGAYKVRNANLRLLYDEALSLLEKFDSWRAEHVRRERNTLADRLANEAMDRGSA